MKKFLIIILTFVALIGVIFAVVLGLTSKERDIARDFVVQVSSGSAVTAHNLLHPQLQKELSVRQLQAMFAGVKPYVDVSFSSIETSGQSTTLKGVAKTADGCPSKLEFGILSDTIISFDINPLCYQ